MIHVNDHVISLDRKEKKSTLDFISHAHSDHISSAKSSKNVIASDETVQLLEAVQGIKVAKSEKQIKGIKLLDAGHILGSKQIYANDECSGKRIAYTGDFQMQDSRACARIKIEDADVAIVDSTYTDPEVQFDDRAETESAMQIWTERRLMDGIVLFGSYALGKAQELITIMNETQIVPVVSEKISIASRVYKKNGVELDYASTYDDLEDYRQIVRGNFVGIVEMHNFDMVRAELAARYNKPVYTAVATGWAKVMSFGTDVQFPLSDHADFHQATEYIDATGAKEVFTYGANAKDLAENLKHRGYSAAPFTKGGRMVCDKISCAIQTV